MSGGDSNFKTTIKRMRVQDRLLPKECSRYARRGVENYCLTSVSAGNSFLNLQSGQENDEGMNKLKSYSH